MTKAHSIRTLVILISCLLLASGAFAAEMVGYGDSASWNLEKADFGGMLSITGPAGVSVQKFFAGNEYPSFSAWDKAGYALPDGQYNWEITLNAAKLERGDAPGEKAAIYSGSFRIENSSIVVPQKLGTGDSDGFGNKDQVFIDDLIVDGSACIGTDCVNGENFGFDTLRLKENNLRIKFQDTSSSGSFPSTDWQLTANSSDNGGLSYFGIEDIDAGRTPFTIEASAPSNSLYVEDSGEVGFGTNNPVVELHVKDGDSPTLRLEQDGSSGFTPQTWDLAGNEANFFVRDVTNGSELPFKIKPGADSGSLFIAADNNVGVGTESPADALHVRRSSTGSSIRLESVSAGAGVRMISGAHDGQMFMASDGELRIRTISGTASEISIDSANAGAVSVTILGGAGANRTVCADNNGTLYTVASGANC